mmetsp:Transcript_13057/g.22760  ORF Transcript_13057/g.22760 Transcript_13057/m.22760 type:complete len:91 (-) Transcript_13057:802-1074(-)
MPNAKPTSVRRAAEEFLGTVNSRGQDNHSEDGEHAPHRNNCSHIVRQQTLNDESEYADDNLSDSGIPTPHQDRMQIRVLTIVVDLVGSRN